MAALIDNAGRAELKKSDGSEAAVASNRGFEVSKVMKA